MNENENDIAYLSSLINRILDDTACPYISKMTLFGSGGGDLIQHRLAWLRSLEKNGVLRFVADPETINDDDACIEMLRFIDRLSSIPGFLNWVK